MNNLKFNIYSFHFTIGCFLAFLVLLNNSAYGQIGYYSLGGSVGVTTPLAGIRDPLSPHALLYQSTPTPISNSTVGSVFDARFKMTFSNPHLGLMVDLSFNQFKVNRGKHRRNLRTVLETNNPQVQYFLTNPDTTVVDFIMGLDGGRASFFGGSVNLILNFSPQAKYNPYGLFGVGVYSFGLSDLFEAYSFVLEDLATEERFNRVPAPASQLSLSFPDRDYAVGFNLGAGVEIQVHRSAGVFVEARLYTVFLNDHRGYFLPIIGGINLYLDRYD